MISQALTALAFSFSGSFVAQRDGTLMFSSIIAERKAFLSKKQLTYRCRVRIDDTSKSILLYEVLEERGSGLSSGNYDDDSAGFGFTAEKYSTTNGTRKGTIHEQSELFGKSYSYTFNYEEVRNAVQKIADNEGYIFRTTLSEREVIKGK